MKKATRTNDVARFEPLEDRRLMSSVHLVDGMLILQGKATAGNRLSVTPDGNGTTLFARANDVKKHFKISDVKSIKIAGGNAADDVLIDPAFKHNAYVRTGSGNDTVASGGGNDTIFGGMGSDKLVGNGGDDVIVGGPGANTVDAGKGDDASKTAANSRARNTVVITHLHLVDAATGKSVGTIGEGSVLNLAKLPKKLNVRADVSAGGNTGSVQFALDGREVSWIENALPFALAGDMNGKLGTWTVKAGQHTLVATHYTMKSGEGYASASKTIKFSVINDASKPAISTGGGTNTNKPTPNPVPDKPTNENPTPQPEDPTPPPPTNNNNNAAAPAPVIDAISTTIPAGTAVHVNAVKSLLKSGDVLGARFEWDFGDGSAKYNKLNGFNAAHVYDKAGSYTVTLKVTNDAGKSASTTLKVTVTPANRRVIYVSPGGNDGNSGRAENAAVKTFARAAILAGDNSEILFQRGGTYTTGSSMNLGHDDIAVGAYGSGADPVITYTGGYKWDAIFTTLGGKNVTIRDIVFDSSNTSTADTGYNDAVRVGGENVTVRDCTFRNVGYALNTNGQPEGFLAMDNASSAAGSIRAYFAWVQGSDHTYVGNKAHDSIRQHVLRIGGADRVLIAHNDFANGDNPGGVTKGTLTIHKGNHVYVAQNRLTSGAVGIGPLDGGAAMDDKGARLRWTVLESNVIDSPVNITHGTEHISVRNNVITRDSSTAINVSGYSDDYDRGVADVYIVGNTALNNGTIGKFLRVGGNVDGISVRNNLYVAPRFTVGSFDSAPIQVFAGDLKGFRVICDNVWPDPTIYEYAQGGINYVGTGNNASGYKDPQEWDAYSVVHHEQYKDVALGSTYQVTLGGVTAGSTLKK